MPSYVSQDLLLMSNKIAASASGMACLERRNHLYNVGSVANLFELSNLHPALQLLLLIGQPSFLLLLCLLVFVLFVVI